MSATNLTIRARFEACSDVLNGMRSEFLYLCDTETFKQERHGKAKSQKNRRKTRE